MNYRCYQIMLSWKYFYTIRERCEVLTEYLPMERQHGDNGVNR